MWRDRPPRLCYHDWPYCIVGGQSFSFGTLSLDDAIENQREHIDGGVARSSVQHLIVLVTFAAIMVACVSLAVGAVPGGAGIGIGFGTQQISRIFSPV